MKEKALWCKIESRKWKIDLNHLDIFERINKRINN